MSDYSESGAGPAEDPATGAGSGDDVEAPAADPDYDEPGDNPLAAEDDDD